MTNENCTIIEATMNCVEDEKLQEAIAQEIIMQDPPSETIAHLLNDDN